MNLKLLLNHSALRNFSESESGAQIVEYALVIAAISLVLIALLATSGSNLGSNFSAMLTSVSTCLGGGAC